MKLWSGETISLFGTRIGSVAMVFAAVITLRATPLQMGLLSAAGYLPSVGSAWSPERGWTGFADGRL
jgi:hypothetical protein